MDASDSVFRAASMIGEPSRATMLWSLLGAESRPASELAMLANISPQTASNHLRQLLDAGLVKVHPIGRNKFYALAGPAVAASLESLAVAGRATTPALSVASHTAPELVFARTCYDHLAGELAVAILRRLESTKRLQPRAGEFRLTRSGEQFFETTLGLHLSSVRAKRRRFAYACLDWSQRVPHLGGALGAALLEWMMRSKIVVPCRSSRAVRLTDYGRMQLNRLFHISHNHAGNLIVTGSAGEQRSL